MARMLVTFTVTADIDEDEEKDYCVDLAHELNNTLVQMENIVSRNFSLYDSNIETEDY